MQENIQETNDMATYKEPYIKLFTSGLKSSEDFETIIKLADSLICSTSLPQEQLSKLVKDVAFVIERTAKDGHNELIASQIQAEEFFLNQFDEPISGYINNIERFEENNVDQVKEEN